SARPESLPALTPTTSTAPTAAATTPPCPSTSAFTASIRANADIHGTRRSPGGDRTPENCGSGPERGLVGFLWGAPGLPSTHAIGRPKTLARLPGAGSRLGPRGWQSVFGLRGCRSPVGLQGPDSDRLLARFVLGRWRIWAHPGGG